MDKDTQIAFLQDIIRRYEEKFKYYENIMCLIEELDELRKIKGAYNRIRHIIEEQSHE